MNALDIAAIGLRSDAERLKVTAHNLANLNTPSFKRQVAVQAPFQSVMEAVAMSSSALPTHTDLRAGKLAPSANAMDVALPEDRYLVLAREGGELALTRQGALQVDAEGVLRTGAGWKVQGLRGHIQLPKDAQTVTIDTMGKVLVDDRVVDELRMVALQPGVSVTSDGQGILRADQAAWVKDLGSMGLRTGHLESSNVVASQEMVHLMGITRHAESMVRVIQASDEMLEKAIRKLGDLA